MLVDAQDTPEQDGGDGGGLHNVPGVPGRTAVQSQQHPSLRANLWSQLREHGRQGDDGGENAGFADHVRCSVVP